MPNIFSECNYIDPLIEVHQKATKYDMLLELLLESLFLGENGRDIFMAVNVAQKLNAMLKYMEPQKVRSETERLKAIYELDKDFNG